MCEMTADGNLATIKELTELGKAIIAIEKSNAILIASNFYERLNRLAIINFQYKRFVKMRRVMAT
jgi:hypothetical protein